MLINSLTKHRLEIAMESRRQGLDHTRDHTRDQAKKDPFCKMRSYVTILNINKITKIVQNKSQLS